MTGLTPQMLDQYVAAVEGGPDSPVSVEWHGFDSFDVTASTTAGQAVLVQETFDPSWRAVVDGRAAPISPDPMDFMLIDMPAGTHTIHIRFETPLENRIGWVVTALTCVFLMGLLIFEVRQRLVRRRSPTTAY